jgi:hypothetical protein
VRNSLNKILNNKYVFKKGGESEQTLKMAGRHSAREQIEPQSVDNVRRQQARANRDTIPDPGGEAKCGPWRRNNGGSNTTIDRDTEHKSSTGNK